MSFLILTTFTIWIEVGSQSLLSEPREFFLNPAHVFVYLSQLKTNTGILCVMLSSKRRKNISCNHKIIFLRIESTPLAVLCLETLYQPDGRQLLIECHSPLSFQISYFWSELFWFHLNHCRLINLVYDFGWTFSSESLCCLSVGCCINLIGSNSQAQNLQRQWQAF